MMFKVEGHKLRSGLLAFALALTAGATLLPVESVHAQIRTLPDFTDLVDQVGPSVVNIRTVEKVAQRGGGNGEMDEEMQEFFRRFFGQPIPGAPRQGPRPNKPQQPQLPQEEERPRGVGSGFILTADGYVMTNAHVVEDASEVMVTLPDKREFKARIIGADKRSDVAVVKIEATGLPAVKVGDISRLRVGEWVIAIGSPFGLENTVTAGIVSAKQRDTGEYLPFIQTDVAVNPGNSGGPLINLDGEVVGINSQIISRSGGFMGISLAIPIDEAMRVVDQLRATGKVTRGRVGVQIGEVGKDVAEAIGLPKAEGALVSSVEAEGPAEQAGVQPGDVILKFNNEPIKRWSDLPRIVGETKPGTRADMEVWRKGKSLTLSVKVGEIPTEKAAAAGKKPAPAPEVTNALGLGVVDVPADVQKKLRIKGGVQVKVAEGAAAKAGLQEGDIVLALNDTDVTGAKQFAELVGKLDKARAAGLLVRRGDQTQWVAVPASK